MVLRYKMHILGLHILVLLNLAHSFVLLTANVEDVRKLARKFVSESLAEQISEFITKLAHSNPAPNVSEENEKNLGEYRITSGENSVFSPIRRERYKKKSQRHQDYEMKMPLRTGDNSPKRSTYTKRTTRRVERTTKKPTQWDQDILEPQTKPASKSDNVIKAQSYAAKTYIENIKVKNAAANQFDLGEGHNIKDASDGDLDYFVKAEPEVPEEVGPPKTTEQPLKYHPNKQSNAPQKAQLEHKKTKTTRRREKLHNKPEFTTTETPVEEKIVSTLGYAEKMEADDNPDSGRYRLDQVASKEDNKTEENSPEDDPVTDVSDKQRAPYPGFNVVRSGSVYPTTEKEKNEFDQYDNKNYPRAEFVATSGPVALPKLPPEPKWLKVEEKVKDYRKKVWF